MTKHTQVTSYNFTEEAALWVAAMRYHLGRSSGEVTEFCAMLVDQWPRLYKSTKRQIQRTLTGEFKRDDAERALPYKHIRLPLGDDGNRADWETVRALWINDDTV